MLLQMCLKHITMGEMKITDQTVQQIERFFRKIAQKLDASADNAVLTDIHVIVSQDSGEMLAFDDDDQEITRCVVEQWIDYKGDDFYEGITQVLRAQLKRLHKVIDGMGVLKPFSVLLENDEREHVAELYVADDDTVIIGGDIMKDMDKDLDDFFDKLMKE